MSSDTNLDFFLVLGSGAGLYYFFKGFRVYRECRVLEDTPEIPIRSMAMGLVHVHGKAKGTDRVPSPVTRTPCLFYKVDIEKWVQDKSGGHWNHYKTHADGPKFYLEDATGQVLVDAHAAEYDLMESANRQTGGGAGLTGLGRLWGGKQDASLAPVAAYVSDGELVSYVESLPEGPKFSMPLGGLSLSSGISLSGGARWGGGRRYRLTEYCILPDHWYDLTGTCVENPSPKDQHDRNLIQKGQNEPTFLISWRAEKQIESALRRKAALHIFGGAALSVTCVGVLLAKLGWL
jgi:hypothetical protein